MDVDDNYYENGVCNDFVARVVVNNNYFHSSSNNSYIVVAANDDDVNNIIIVLVVDVNVRSCNNCKTAVVAVDIDANANAVVKAYNDNVATYVYMVDGGSVDVADNYFECDCCLHKYSHYVVA